ncbi:MAG: hypothetical protein ACXVCP_00420 [Bdellovibrio sp.]
MKNFKLLVKDINNNILHEPEFKTRLEAEEMQALILEKNEWNFPEGFTTEIQDNTASIEAEKTKAAQKQKDRGDRVTSLKTIDWSKVNSITEIKAILKALVDDNLKDEQ